MRVLARYYGRSIVNLHSVNSADRNILVHLAERVNAIDEQRQAVALRFTVDDAIAL